MGKIKNPSVRFYMRAKEFGYIQCRISYNYKQYTGKLKLWCRVIDFQKLNSDGTIKDPSDTNRLETYEGIDLSELLILFASTLTEELKKRIAEGKEINKAYADSLLNFASGNLERQLVCWPSLKNTDKVEDWKDYFNPLENWEIKKEVAL